MSSEETTQYIYIAQASNERAACKIGKTSNLENRLKDYNTFEGNSIDVVYRFLFTCEVANMTKVEGDIKKKFKVNRQKSNKEMFFFNEHFIEDYISFIREHPLFIKEIFVNEEVLKPKQAVKYVLKDTPSLAEREVTRKDIMEKAKKVANDEFYTRYEDIEKEIAMYDKNI